MLVSSLMNSVALISLIDRVVPAYAVLLSIQTSHHHIDKSAEKHKRNSARFDQTSCQALAIPPLDVMPRHQKSHWYRRIMATNI